MKHEIGDAKSRYRIARMLIVATAAGSLALVLFACGSSPSTPGPSPTVLVPIDGPSPAPPTNMPTEPPPTPAPTEPVQMPVSTAVCPAAGSPTLAQPGNPADYPAAIQQYLSAGGDVATLEAALTAWEALPDATTAQLAASDLSGDGNPEIVIALQRPVDLLIFRCQGGVYVPGYSLRQGAERWEASWVVNLIQVDDVTMDGQLDVAFTLSTCGAHTCYKTLDIVSWDGAAFTSLMGGNLDMPYPDYILVPGRIEAQSGPIGSVGAEPQRGYAEVWEWDGSVFTVTQQIWEPPIYRYHALLDGDRALLSGDYATAIATYERVISDEALQQWGEVSGIINPAEERAQLAAFARWRLVLVHLLAGDVGSAQSMYDQLQADYPAEAAGRDVAAMAEVFWTAYLASSSIAEGCTEVATAARSNTAIQDFFNWTYGYANPYWESLDLCPFVE